MTVGKFKAPEQAIVKDDSGYHIGLIFRLDKQVGLEQISQRFELPYDTLESPMFPELLEKAARKVAREAVEKNALRGYHWRSDLGVEIDESQLQIPLDFFGTSASVLPSALDSGVMLRDKYNIKAFVLKMWFTVPMIPTLVEDVDDKVPFFVEEDGFTTENPSGKEFREIHEFDDKNYGDK